MSNMEQYLKPEIGPKNTNYKSWTDTILKILSSKNKDLDDEDYKDIYSMMKSKWEKDNNNINKLKGMFGEVEYGYNKKGNATSIIIRLFQNNHEEKGLELLKLKENYEKYKKESNSQITLE